MLVLFPAGGSGAGSGPSMRSWWSMLVPEDKKIVCSFVALPSQFVNILIFEGVSCVIFSMSHVVVSLVMLPVLLCFTKSAL